MKNALDRVDKLIKSTLNPTNLQSSDLTEEESIKLQSFAEEEYEQICDHLK